MIPEYQNLKTNRSSIQEYSIYCKFAFTKQILSMDLESSISCRGIQTLYIFYAIKSAQCYIVHCEKYFLRLFLGLWQEECRWKRWGGGDKWQGGGEFGVNLRSPNLA